MAQIEDIFEQVDEQLEAERAHKFWQENRNTIIGGLVLLFVGLFAYVGWQDARRQEDRRLSDLYLQAQERNRDGQRDEAEKILVRLMAEGENHGYGLLARLVDAQALAKEGRVDAALVHLESLAVQTVDPLLQGVALLNAAYLVADQTDRSRGYLSRIGETSPFYPHALELDGLLLSRDGDREGARDRYRKALLLEVDSQLRTRLDRRLERLAGHGE